MKVSLRPADLTASIAQSGAGTSTDVCDPGFPAFTKANVIIRIEADGSSDVGGSDPDSLARTIYSTADLGSLDISLIRVRVIGTGTIGSFPDPNEAEGQIEYSTNGGGVWTLVPGTVLFSSAASGVPHVNLDIYNWWIEVRGSGGIIEG